MSGLVTRRRLVRLGGVASVQVAVQVLGFAAGLVLVRSMDQVQYGYYTLALSMVSIGAILTDLGLASAVMAIGGRLIGGRAALGHLVADAHVLHRQLSLLSMVVLVPGFCAMLLHQGTTPQQCAVLLMLTLASCALHVRIGVAQTMLRLLGAIGRLQRLDLAVNAARLVILLVAAAVVLDASLAVLVNLGVAVFMWWMLRRHLTELITPAPVPGAAHTQALLDQVRRQAPNAIYFVLSSQLAVWLIGIFGQAQQVAEVGALGRLGALFSVLGAVTATLVLPYFAKRHSATDLGAGLASVNVFFVALLAVLLASAWTWPTAMLWVLGDRYAALHAELLWMVAAATLAAWGGTLYSLGCARGWVVPFGWVVGAGIVSTAVAASLVDVATVRGGLAVGTANAAAGTAVSFLYLVWQLRRQYRLKVVPA